MSSRPLTAHRFLSGVAICLLALVACSTSAPKQTRLMREQTKLGVSAEELRIRVRALAMPFSGMIEEAAEALVTSSDDPAVRRVALRWKINTIPAIQSALFDPDPLVALFDTWSLVAQMRLFFEQGQGAALPAGVRSQALQTVARMDTELERLVRSIAQPGGAERMREGVYAWAANNPIELTVASRRSATGDLAALAAEANPGIRQAIGGLSLGLGDVWARLDTYSAWLPKQARWQAELLVSEMVAGEEVGGALSDFNRLTGAIEDIAATVKEAPGLVASEREAVLHALQAERIATLEVLNREFVAAIETILERRTLAAESILEKERLAALEALAAERIAVLGALRDERIATLEDLDRVVGGLAEDSLRRTVDYAFVRVLQLLAIVVALAVAAAFVYVRVNRR